MIRPRTLCGPNRPSTKAARRPTQVRAPWVAQVVDAVQVLTGGFNLDDLEAVQLGLIKFEGRCPPPSTIAEGLVLRGILLDAFLRLDNTLYADISSEQRESARTRESIPFVVEIR